MCDEIVVKVTFMQTVMELKIVVRFAVFLSRMRYCYGYGKRLIFIFVKFIDRMMQNEQ